MRYYLIDQEKDELVIDLQLVKKHDNNLFEFQLCFLENNVIKSTQLVYTRKLAGQYFVSLNLSSWEKVSPQVFPRIFLDRGKVYDLYRGFKPSGLGEVDEGELVTHMPGKVVKIEVEKGQEVKKGQTLIVLEAMKMENEIKSGMDGIVKSVHVQEGQVLDEGILMMEVERD